MITVALFNHKGGVGKTALTYHLTWTFASLGHRVLTVDLDPQANLSSLFLPDERLESIWPDGDHPDTVLGAIQPILSGLGDVDEATVVQPDEDEPNIGLLVGDLGLSAFEAKVAEAWPRTLDKAEDALRVTTAFHRMIQGAGASMEADLAILDVGPNLGALNRAALLAAQFVVVPLVPDLFSIQGLRNLGPTLAEWRDDWQLRRDANRKNPRVDLPSHPMHPIGYIVQPLALRRRGQSPEAYERWAQRIPDEYRRRVLNEVSDAAPWRDEDEHCLAKLKHYRSLMLMAMEARKPIFRLKPADGAIGSHGEAVRACGRDFRLLARTIGERVGLPKS